MKKFLHFKKIILAVLFLGLCSTGWTQILYEEFNYPTPAYIGGNGAAGSTSNNWTTHSVTTGQTTTVDIQDASLTYPGFAASTGNKVYLWSNGNATSRDINRGFTPTTASVLYFSALITLVDNSQITVTGDYFMHFGAASGASNTTFGGRLGAKSVNAGANFRFAIMNTSTGTTTFTDNGADLVFGTTYLVVVKYDRTAIPTVASMWVNPASLGGTEPSGAVTNSSGTGSFSTFASICLRNSATTPKAYIDEIRVGAAWADVTPTGAAAPAISVNSPATGDQWRQGTTHNITWSATSTNANVKIEYTDNASAGTPTWTTLNASIAANAGTWAWSIPAGQALSADCKIRISDIPQTVAGSSGTFSIVLPPVQISTLAALRAVTPGTATVYTYTGQGILTFKQTFRKQKFIQDATAAVLIDDNAGKITTTYNLGDAITNISGTVAVFNGMLQFTPESDPGAASSTGNTITPEVVTLAQLNANWENYEAELIKIPNISFTSPTGNFGNGIIYPVTDNIGGAGNFRTTFFDVDYINTPVPVVREDIVVIPNSRVDGDHITSRTLADFQYNSSNDIMITEIMYNPQDGGNDSIEFIELYNKGAASVNIKDWFFSKGVTYVFPDQSIAANSYYVVAREALSMHNTFGITCAQWTEGFLDDSGEPVVLKDAIGQVKDSVYYLPTAPWPTAPNNGGPSLTFCNTTLDNSLGQNWSASTNQVAVNGLGQPIYASPGSSCSSGANLVITEIMYNPPESGTDSLEFVEIYNKGTTVNLLGFKVSDAFTFTFPSFDLAAGQYMLVSLKSSAILNTFGKPSLQWTTGSLSNSGEAITLHDLYGVMIDQVTYGVAAPWPTRPNGLGASLTLCDPNANNSLPASWTASNEFVVKNAAGDSIFATPLAGCYNPPTVANFDATPTTLLQGQSAQFHDLSTNNPTSWAWTFTGGTPATSVTQNPLIQYNTYGLYSVSLTAANAYGGSTLTKTNYISVGVDGITTLPSSVSVYPNPTNGKFSITNPYGGTQEITLYSALGKQLNSAISSEEIISLDITGQTAGLYLVRITNKVNHDSQTIRVVLK
jgi:PKD repeat protein